MSDENPTPRFVVVADRFATFAENDSVLTMGAVASALDAGHPLDVDTLTPGQGVGPEEWAWLTARTARLGAPARGDVPAKLARHEVIKLTDANVLLADLRRTDARTFRADLVISSDTEMIVDHTADRQHVPGMLLMEACCQLLIAATGRFLRERRPGTRYYAVMQEFAIRFHHFVFPLPASLSLRIDSWDSADRERPAFAVTIDIEQSGRLCARASWRYRAFQPDTLFAIEAGQARVALAGSHARGAEVAS